MALPLTDLDDRRWADLIEEGRALIPVHAPEWTDHNVHDPGITLIELFAWLAETDIYRLNRVSAARRNKFLALIGIAPEPPRGARTAVGFELTDGAPTTFLPAGLTVEGDDLSGAPTRFRTRRGLAVVSGSLEALQTCSGGELIDLTARWRRGELVAGFGEDPRPGSALYLGLRFPGGQPAEPVSFHFGVAGGDRTERERLFEQVRRVRQACLPAPSLVRCDPDADAAGETFDSREEADDALLVHHSARLVWEAHLGGNRWRTLEPHQVRDATRAFTLSGPVELKLPAAAIAARLGQVDAELYYLRCRLHSGAFDAAPEIDWALLNGVAIEQTVLIEDEGLGVGAGLPRQQVALDRPLVCGPGLRLNTQEDGEWKVWSERADFDASDRTDSHFVVDRRSGTVVFGDGEHGRIVPHRAAIEATYCSTRGPAGNLEAGSVTQLADTPTNRALVPLFKTVSKTLVRFHQPRAASGGWLGETLDEAASRAFELIERTERAVTLADYETLARRAPGVRLARVVARANLHPAFPCFQAPGVVTLIVVPHLPVRRPTPSAGLRRALAAYIDGRRPLGTRLEVVGPSWVEVRVRATVRACAAVDRSGLAGRLRRALDDFFHPLVGGPEGEGWPFGRDVYRSEVLQVLDESSGVDHVLALDLLGDGGVPSCGNLCVPPGGLVVAAPHEIEVVRGEP